MRKKSSLFYKPKTATLPKAKRRWVILPYFWRAIKYVCMSIGAMILISMIVGFFMTASLMQKVNVSAEIPKEVILFYRMEGAISEGLPASGFDAFGPQKLSITNIMSSLEVAARDPRVKALIFSVRSSEMPFSQMQELRQAILDFRKASQKPAYIYSLSYGEAGQGLPLYTFASAFDEIWLAPLGTVSVNGMQIEQPYMRGLLDRLGIEPQFFQREEYKGVFENFTHKTMSPYSRESLQELTESLVQGFIQDIIQTRPSLVKEHDLPAMINQGIFLDTEAVEAGLVDRVEYGDVLLDQLREKLGGNLKDKTPEMISLAQYYNILPAPQERAKDIAIIHVQGPIMILNEGQSGNGILGDTSDSADKIASLIIGASEDEKISAIVLRVDSPGGSPTASELIRRAVLRAQQNGKPVIVSMGSMAASGGYWVSAPADYIYASAGTITGSIGVAGGKVSMREFWDHIDVNWDHVAIGKNAGMYSFMEPFSESERALIDASMDRIYDMFLGVVAEGRNMSREDVRAVAKGRVWSGKDALKQGLVDEIGGLNDALDYAAQKSGFKTRHDVNILTLPKPKTPIEEILDLFQKTAGLPIFFQQQSALLNMLLGDEQKKLMQDAAVLNNGTGLYVYEPMSSLR